MSETVQAAKGRTAAILKSWNRRETDLLEANNRYLERARQAESALAESRREVSELREGLKSCRNQFLMYANSHAAKGTSEGDAKAVTNREFAEMCAALVNGEGGK